MIHAEYTGALVESRYRIHEPLGHGGMGTVYVAEHVNLRQRRAIKFLRKDISRKPGVEKRFLQEARVLSSLQHQHLVAVFDVGHHDGVAYYVMELLVGEDLRARLQRSGPLGWPLTRTIALQICEALQVTHAKGIIHRDLKPGNCLCIGPHERPDEIHIKLIDFGVAKVPRDMGGTSHLTGTGEALGTIGYMAPEQFEGLGDQRVDVYALGVMIFEMLTGRPLYSGSAFEIIARMLRDNPPRLRDALPDADPAIDTIETVESAQPVAPPSRRKLWLASATGLVTVGVLFLSTVWRSASVEPPDVATAGLLSDDVTVYRPELIRLAPSGRFLLGSMNDERDEYLRGPLAHLRERVDNESPRWAIVHALYACTTEVTRAQWQAVMGTPAPCMDDCEGEHPVSKISWHEACEYMIALTQHENRIRVRRGQPALTRCYEWREGTCFWTNPDCTGFRMPTENEWEYMARAGSRSAYSFGNDPHDMCRHGNVADLSAAIEHPDWAEEALGPMFDCDDESPDLAPVRSYLANPWGLHDMHGNVIEWTWDWYDPRPEYDPEPARETSFGYAGPKTGRMRVARGGSWIVQVPTAVAALRLRTCSPYTVGF